MKVKLLLVEDDASWRDLVAKEVSQLGPTVSLQMARSRDAAGAILKEESFDLVILDLKIPTVDEALDANVEHGRYVFETLSSETPGTPVLILTGSPAESFITDFLARSTKVDVWGDGEVSTVSFLKKSDVDLLAEILSKYVKSVKDVSDVEIAGAGGLNFSWDQARIIKIFVRRSGGVSCKVSRISGGLSGSDVYKISITDERGASVLHSILKIGSPAMVAKESGAYRTYVNRLHEKATARFISEIKFGGGRSAGVAYRLADSFTASMFDIVRTRPTEVEGVIEKLRGHLAPWIESMPEQRIKIREVRQRLVGDAKADKLIEEFGLDWARILEDRYVQVKIGCCHGDFHGCNVLVDDNSDPIIIDYGDIDPGPACLDWVSLELSLLFHVEGCARSTKWPTEEHCKKWSDQEQFASGGDFANFVGACRSNALSFGAGNREICAAAYAYLLRQLAYDDTDKDRVLALLSSVRECIDVS